MDCSTIIVSYNTFDLTAEAVRTALQSGSGLQHEVIVVDNDSPDGSGNRLRSEFERDTRVVVLDMGTNAGFAAANNEGARRATGRVLFFLNPDTLVLDRAIPVLADFLDRTSDAGAVGPRVLNPDRTVQRSTSTFPSPLSMVRHRFPVFARQRRPATVPTPVDVVVGCAFALRREAFDAVGGWDERYFMYSEENEICLALLGKGLRSYIVPDAEIVHFGGQSSKDRYAEQQVVAAESEMAFLSRHGGLFLRTFARATGALGFGGRALVFRLLAAARPERRAEYQRRGSAAAALWRFYVGLTPKRPPSVLPGSPPDAA